MLGASPRSESRSAFGEALIVETVAAFVQHGEDGGGEVVFAHADGEPHVVGAGEQRERMGRAVKPPALEFEPDRPST